MKQAEKYIGRTFHWSSHYLWDGISTIYLRTWNMDTHAEEIVAIGDNYDTSTETLLNDVVFGLKPEVLLDAQVTYYRRSKDAWERYVAQERSRICKDRRARVVRGRKVRVGTEIEVFWVGERMAYYQPRYGSGVTETIAGGYDDAGNKVWVKAEYLENLTPVEFTKQEELAWRKNWMLNNIPCGIRFKHIWR